MKEEDEGDGSVMDVRGVGWCHSRINITPYHIRNWPLQENKKESVIVSAPYSRSVSCTHIYLFIVIFPL